MLLNQNEINKPRDVAAKLVAFTTDEEREAHQAMLARLTKTSEREVDWG